MKFEKSTYNIIKNCLTLVTWEMEEYIASSDEYEWLEDIRRFLDKKIYEITTIPKIDESNIVDINKYREINSWRNHNGI